METLEEGVHVEGSNVGLYSSGSPFRMDIDHTGIGITENGQPTITVRESRADIPRITTQTLIIGWIRLPRRRKRPLPDDRLGGERMPSITLTPSACTSGTSGWINLYYHSTNQNSAQPRQLIFTVPANATLGGAGINITGITLHAYVRNSSSAVKQLQYGCKTGTGAAPTAWAQINGANVLDWAFTAVGHGNGSYIYRYVARALSGAALERFAAHMQARFAAGQALYLGVVQPEDGKSIQVNTALGNWAIDVTYELLGNVPVGERQHGDAGEHGDHDDAEQGHFGIVNDDTLQNWFYHACHVQYRHGRYAHVYCAHQRWQ